MCAVGHAAAWENVTIVTIVPPTLPLLVCWNAVARDRDELPKGWERPIPDALWPEAMMNAIRADVAALASPRVIETIRAWQKDARDPSDPKRQREAFERLRLLQDALVPVDTSEIGFFKDLRSRVVDDDRLPETVMPDSDVLDAFASDPSIKNQRDPPRESDASSSSGRPAPKPRGSTRSTTDKGLLTPPSRNRVEAHPKARSPSFGNPNEILVDDDAILGEEPDGAARPVSQIEEIERELEKAEAAAAAMPSREFDDEKPTTLRKTAQPAPPVRGGGFYRAARVDPFAEEDEKPTASIPIPEQMQRRAGAVAGGNDAGRSDPRPVVPVDETLDRSNEQTPTPSGVPNAVKPTSRPQPPISSGAPSAVKPSSRPQPPIPSGVPNPAVKPSSRSQPPIRATAPESDVEEDDDESTTYAEPRKERTIAARDAPRAPINPLVSVTPMSSEDAGRLAPKPGIVKRRAMSRKDSPARPRAAMQTVKAIYAVVLPFCEELIPLAVERRSRRFWARWRELTGDRGVRREFVEDLLQSANDVRTLACELIAEVQNVDVKSVYALVSKIESGEPRGTEPKPIGTPERQRGPIASVSVRVQGATPPADRDDD
jgi:hypothetical protein